jgi:hypothetical protein
VEAAHYPLPKPRLTNGSTTDRAVSGERGVAKSGRSCVLVRLRRRAAANAELTGHVCSWQYGVGRVFRFRISTCSTQFLGVLWNALAAGGGAARRSFACFYGRAK